MKELKTRLEPDRVPQFETSAQAFAKKIVANFKDFEFVSQTY
jgi:Translationally controlled tumour protein